VPTLGEQTVREALAAALSRPREGGLSVVVNHTPEQMADVILPELVDALALALHRYQHGSHLGSTGCRTGHRIEARWMLNLTH